MATIFHELALILIIAALIVAFIAVGIFIGPGKVALTAHPPEDAARMEQAGAELVLMPLAESLDRPHEASGWRRTGL